MFAKTALLLEWQPATRASLKDTQTCSSLHSADLEHLHVPRQQVDIEVGQLRITQYLSHPIVKIFENAGEKLTSHIARNLEKYLEIFRGGNATNKVLRDTLATRPKIALVTLGLALAGCAKSNDEFARKCTGIFDVIVFDHQEWNAYLTRAMVRYERDKERDEALGSPAFFDFFFDENITAWSRIAISNTKVKCDVVEPEEFYLAADGKGVFAIIKDYRIDSCGFSGSSQYTCSTLQKKPPKFNIIYADNEKLSSEE